MPKDVKIVRIFVAGPGDVDDERRQLEDVADELNVTWSERLGIRLDLLTWRRHAIPGAGVDAQDVVNRSMPQDYDVFLGIMWSRFGTPTARAGSGTEEEFERALSRHRENPDAVHLMMYFKDDPVPPSRIDPLQIARVQEFRVRLEGEGVLYWTFTSPFESTVRVHLAREIQAWVNARPGPVGGDWSANTSSATEESRDEPGLIDSADLFMTQLGSSSTARSRIIAAVLELYQTVLEQGPAMEKTTDGMVGVRRLMEWRAVLLERFATKLNDEIPGMNQSFDAAMDNLGRTIALAGEVGMADSMKSPNWERALQQMQETLRSDSEFLLNLRATLANTGRFTTRLNHAKRAALKELDRLMASFDHQIQTFKQVLKGSTDESA